MHNLGEIVSLTVHDKTIKCHEKCIEYTTRTEGICNEVAVENALQDNLVCHVVYVCVVLYCVVWVWLYIIKTPSFF